MIYLLSIEYRNLIAFLMSVLLQFVYGFRFAWIVLISYVKLFSHVIWSECIFSVMFRLHASQGWQCTVRQLCNSYNNVSGRIVPTTYMFFLSYCICKSLARGNFNCVVNILLFIIIICWSSAFFLYSIKISMQMILNEHYNVNEICLIFEIYENCILTLRVVRSTLWGQILISDSLET